MCLREKLRLTTCVWRWLCVMEQELKAGVRVANVRDDGRAAQSGITAGDTILAVSRLSRKPSTRASIHPLA